MITSSSTTSNALAALSFPISTPTDAQQRSARKAGQTTWHSPYPPVLERGTRTCLTRLDRPCSRRERGRQRGLGDTRPQATGSGERVARSSDLDRSPHPGVAPEIGCYASDTPHISSSALVDSWRRTELRSPPVMKPAVAEDGGH